MKILIIGGTRFMGPLVVRKLLADGHKVAVFHRGQSKADLPDTLVHFLGDRNRLKDYADQIARYRPDVVVDMMLLTERQARELIEALYGVCANLVVISSCDVYRNYDLLRGVETGATDEDRITETGALREKLYPYRNLASDQSDIFYDYEKILVEDVVASVPDLKTTALRLPMVYGPGDYQHRFYGYIKRMTDNRPAIILEKGQETSKITRGYCENCADAIVSAIYSDPETSRVYNVGDSEALTEMDWIRLLAAEIGWKGDILVFPRPELPQDLKTEMYWQYHLDIDTSRIRSELGYREKIDREEALRRTIDWEVRNPPQQNGKHRIDYSVEDRLISTSTSNGKDISVHRLP